MKVPDGLPQGCETFAGAEIFTHGHLPVAAAYCRCLGLVELVDEMVPTQMALRPGLTTQAMVLDVLSGRMPLYRVEQFLLGQDIELLLGEADAKTAATEVEKRSSRLHVVAAKVSPVEVRRRGRPPKTGLPLTNTRYELSWELTQNTVAVERERLEAGCFVLLSNVPTEGAGALDAARLLQTYKGQYAVESDFAFLKDPLVVNDLFLKTPSRIDALGMVLIIALMIWRLMERTMRAHIENAKTTLPGWDNKKITKPTAFMMMTTMTNIIVAVIDGKRHLLCSPNIRQMAFLKAMGLDESVFIDPHCRCQPIIPLKLASTG